MQFHLERIHVPMMSGDNPAFDVLSFDCQGHRLSVRKINHGLCYVLHRPTGLKITAEWTGDPKEAAKGFADAVAVKAYDLSKVAQAAASFPTINH